MDYISHILIVCLITISFWGPSLKNFVTFSLARPKSKPGHYSGGLETVFALKNINDPPPTSQKLLYDANRVGNYIYSGFRLNETSMKRRTEK